MHSTQSWQKQGTSSSYNILAFFQHQSMSTAPHLIYFHEIFIFTYNHWISWGSWLLCLILSSFLLNNSVRGETTQWLPKFSFLWNHLWIPIPRAILYLHLSEFFLSDTLHVYPVMSQGYNEGSWISKQELHRNNTGKSLWQNGISSWEVSQIH